MIIFNRSLTRSKVTLNVDNFVSSTSTGQTNEPIRLDGILFLGGARQMMFGHLPAGILSRHGYLGCVASLELGDQSIHPLVDAVVPSQEVIRGCTGQSLTGVVDIFQFWKKITHTSL